MPLTVYAPGNVSTTQDVAARPLHPAIAPGASRPGTTTKPAILINDAWALLLAFTDSGTTQDFQRLRVSLKLSQERDLTPGLVLDIATVYAAKTATANLWNSIQVQEAGFHHAGTVWAAKYVGIQIDMGVGNLDNITWEVYLDYDIIEIPWDEWFLRWDFLDNIVDNDREY